ncbi:MAG TPA: bacterial Ig-like domain-containing protein, partial [Acidimicrobiia bacterium]
PGSCDGNQCSASEAGEYTVTVTYLGSEATATLNVVDLDLGTGDVEVFLQWTGPADMDLWVTDPDGCQVKWSRTSCPSGGTLQVDVVPACNSSITDIHVEQIYWPEGGASAGNYVATADAYGLCSFTTSWTMTIYVNGSLAYQINGTHTTNEDGQNVSQGFTVPGPA